MAIPRESQSKISLAPWILLALFILQFAVSFQPDVLAFDGLFYYAYTRSTIFDGDLRLGNDFVLSYDAAPGFAKTRLAENLTPTGRAANPFPIGTPLLWLPWFAFIYVLARLAALLGFVADTITGYEWYFRWGLAAVTCVYGWLAVLTAYRLARKFVSDWAALVASATVMFTTPLCYYQFREPFYAHAASAMTTAFFVAAWWHFTYKRSLSPPSAFLLGALGGLSALVRSQNVTYLILPVLTGFSTAWPALRQRDWQTVRRISLQVLLVGLGTSLVLTLQFTVWYVFYGQLLVVPQGATFMDWSAPWVRHVLFSAFHGLLPWMPLTLPAAAGLVLLARRTFKVSIPLMVALLLQIYVNGCARDWFGGGGYGARRFSNALVILLIGYACLLDWRDAWWYRLLVVVLSGLLVLHQWLILRFGFAAHIGGYVVSMVPAYEWLAQSHIGFWRQLAGYIPLAIRNPIWTLVQSDSPIQTLNTSLIQPVGQFLLLFGVLGTVRLAQKAWQRLLNHFAGSTSTRRLLLIGGVSLILLADWWLLSRA